MKFVRSLWGDESFTSSRYKSQIQEALADDLRETVYVWGMQNYEYLRSLNFECVLVSEKPYDYSLASNHTFYDYRSLNHKLECLKLATIDYGEVIFIDWDCKKIRNIDRNFVSLLREGRSLQVPLYVYPPQSLEKLIRETAGNSINSFFLKLRDSLELFSYRWEDNYVLPNTGFIYCRDSENARDLMRISLERDLQTVPDELSVFIYAKEILKFDLENYISEMEPYVIGGKDHGEDSQWTEVEEKLKMYINNKKPKATYFSHQ